MFARQALDIGDLLPVFIPSALMENGAWPGPFLNLGGVILTWGAPLPDHSVQYIGHKTQRDWEIRGIDWRARSIDNLRRISPDPLATGALFRESGEMWLISLMYPDGLGPSRLLLTEELERIFPNGYRVALPERNRAFAFALSIDREDMDTVENLIQRSYSTSNQPLWPEIFLPSDLLSTIPSGTT